MACGRYIVSWDEGVKQREKVYRKKEREKKGEKKAGKMPAGSPSPILGTQSFWKRKLKERNKKNIQRRPWGDSTGSPLFESHTHTPKWHYGSLAVVQCMAKSTPFLGVPTSDQTFQCVDIHLDFQQLINIPGSWLALIGIAEPAYLRLMNNNPTGTNSSE